MSKDNKNPSKITHVVAKGETLRTISKLYYGQEYSWKKIFDYNPPLQDPARANDDGTILIPGEKLEISLAGSNSIIVDAGALV